MRRARRRNETCGQCVRAPCQAVQLEVEEADGQAVALLKEEAATATHTAEASVQQAPQAFATFDAHVLDLERQLAAARASRVAYAAA